MMNSNPTSKIVVGVALAAVFSVGVSLFVVNAKHQEAMARNAPPPAPTQLGPNAAAPDATAQGQTAPPAAAAPADPSAPTATAPPSAAPSPAP